jgi:predicted nucleotidyltransferase
MTGGIPEIVATAGAILLQEGAREVYVFGSWARGEARDGSDLDLAVTGLPPEHLLRAMQRVTDATRRMVDVVETEREPAFIDYLRSRGELRRVA